MRIITGTARGAKLKTLDGDEITRPTTERVKEAVFSMIQFEIEGANIFDAFGGSGQMALECLSRGAKHAVICDNNPLALSVIRENAQKTRLDDKCTILSQDAMRYAKTTTEKFDIVFVDPPYATKLQRKMIDTLIANDAIAPGGIIVCESGEEMHHEPEGYTIRRKAKYSKVHITIYEKENKE